jgi:imidazole glycerol phosphate synthase glutamine amidotransferase subunit
MTDMEPVKSAVTVIDYGAGNLASLEGALSILGWSYRRAATPAEAFTRGPLLLPGVGHFGPAAAALRRSGWWTVLQGQATAGRPLVGICLGLQLLTEGSEEAPGIAGLGLLSGAARRLGGADDDRPLKVPHIGWARVNGRGPEFVEDPWLYFVHSYALDPSEETLALAVHGRPFAAVAGRGNVLGIQAHPEKSGRQGVRLLGQLLERASRAAA